MRRTIIMLLLVAFSGCVPRADYEELQEELRKSRAENNALREELGSRRMKNIQLLEGQLTACEQQVGEVRKAGEALARKSEEAGYYKGAADFNRSLQVIGVPRSSGWWIFSEHYYTFQVSLAGQPLYSMTVETQDNMPPVIQGLALIAELRDVIPYRELREIR